MIYFITDGEYIKIGYTRTYPIIRLKELQTGNPKPLKLLATMEGGLSLEKELHNTFRPYKAQGEWFRSSGEILEYITTYATAYVEPQKCEEIEISMQWRRLNCYTSVSVR
jgi:T5orf172 domain.